MALDPIEELIGSSPVMASLRAKVRRLLRHRAEARRFPPVLLCGETGTGKGLLARVLHRAGPRRDGAFVEINCAAIPESLLEAELFGFERGAFTDARHAKPGLFQIAHRGTLFLDEIGLLPEALQAKLLKVLEEQTVRRLGGTRPEPVDVWVVAATNEDITAAVQRRRFREDLFHRLAVVTLMLPPLRDRGDDVLVLAAHLLGRVCHDYGLPAKTFSADAETALERHPWPGNVRELGNVLERAALLGEDRVVTAAELDLMRVSAPEAPASTARTATTLDAATRQHLQHVLEETRWNVSRAAAQLGVTRNTVRARIEKYGLSPSGAAPPRRVRARAATVPSTPEPAPSLAGPPLRWEQRRVALLRAVLGEPGGSGIPGDALERIIEKIEAFGGRIDGLGPREVIGMFGIDTPEDMVTIAAHAAHAIRRAIAGQDSAAAVRVALHTVPALVSDGAWPDAVDATTRREAWSALDGLAAVCPPGEIIASTAAAMFLKRRFDVDPIAGTTGAHRVGRRAPVGNAAEPERPFVGRVHELALLRGRLDRAAHGAAHFVGIMGEAGLGKSRLVRELLRDAGADTVHYLEGNCLPFTSAIPYFPLCDIVRGACGFADADPPSTIAARVADVLSDVGLAPAEAPYLLQMLGIKDGVAPTELESPEVVRARTFELVRQLLLRQSLRRPLLLVVEDVHWIDETSSSLLESLADVMPQARILLVQTFRPGYRPPAVDRSYATQITLTALSRDDSRRIVDGVLPARNFSSSVTDAVLAKAEGNPFLLEELARHVADRGDIGQPGDIPDTVHAVITARLARLDRAPREVLLTAAVIGHDVARAVLASVAELDEGELDAVLRKLRAGEFLVDSGFGPDTMYSFKHVLIQDVAYATLAADRRRRLHGRTLDAMEKLFADRLPEHRARLAHHALRGERWPAAARYLRDAGIDAAARSAYREAVVLFEQALATLARLPADREYLALGIDIRFELRNVLWALGRLNLGLDYLREAEALATQLGDRRRLARLSAHTTSNYMVIGENERALQSGERALEIAVELGDAGLTVDSCQLLGVIHTSLGKFHRAVDFLETNLRALSDPRGRFARYYAVHARTWLVWSLVELGDLQVAQTRVAEAIALAEEAQDPRNSVAAYWAAGYLHQDARRRERRARGPQTGVRDMPGEQRCPVAPAHGRAPRTRVRAGRARCRRRQPSQRGSGSRRERRGPVFVAGLPRGDPSRRGPARRRHGVGRAITRSGAPAAGARLRGAHSSHHGGYGGRPWRPRRRPRSLRRRPRLCRRARHAAVGRALSRRDGRAAPGSR